LEHAEKVHTQLLLYAGHLIQYHIISGIHSYIWWVPYYYGIIIMKKKTVVKLRNTFLVNKNMSIEELSKVENIIGRIEVYICSSIPLILVTAARRY
jgi:hypothetical protein